MAEESQTRRRILKGGLAAAGLGVLGFPEWALPALAQDEEVILFTDIPENFDTNPRPMVRFLDIRNIDGPFTPSDQFFTVQHLGQPEVDGDSFRLKVTGLVDRELELSLGDLRAMGNSKLAAGFECSGNSGTRLQALSSNGDWTGLPLAAVLNEAGLQADGHEVVFFGADHGEEEVEFRARKYTVDQQYGRSLSRSKALSGTPFLAYELNGEPLTTGQGFPLRLIVPGWYGAANVKWLSQIHVQAGRYLGNYQARWYRTLRGEMIDGEMKWIETDISTMRGKSQIARVTRRGSSANVFGFVLNDGTPIKSVEVKVDDGPWREAKLDPTTKAKYSWKFFNYTWSNPTPGEHTLVSRVTDVKGNVQPEAPDLENKKTFLEDNAQTPRTVMIS